MSKKETKVETTEEKYDRLIFNTLIKKIKKRIVKEINQKIDTIIKWKCFIYVNDILIYEFSNCYDQYSSIDHIVNSICKDRFKEAIVENVEYTEIKVDVLHYGNSIKVEL